MKLAELATIRRGLGVPEEKLGRGQALPLGSYWLMKPGDFDGVIRTFVPEKELKKLPEFSHHYVLEYGDYLLWWADTEAKLLRYVGTDRRAVASDSFLILRSNFSILQDFLSIDSNRAYVFNELRRLGGVSVLNHELVGEIEIGADNITELNEANEAENLGLHHPLDASALPLNIAQKPITIDKLLKRIEHDELMLDTEFQRRPGLWGHDVKSRLIESMVVRLPIPAFYFDGSNDDEWLVIDGLQRLSAVREFVKEEYRLSGMLFLPDLEGKTFSQLARVHQRNIEEYEVFAYILQKGTPKSVAYRIFKNINTSALTLVPQEIRHALNPGVPARFLKEVAESNWFRAAVPLYDRKRDRMEDRETVLRFLAFQLRSFRDYKPSIVEYLDMAMTQMYGMPQVQQDTFKRELESILGSLCDMFGGPPFSRSIFDPERQTYIHNNILFELLTFGLALVPLQSRASFGRRLEVRSGIEHHLRTRITKFWEYEEAYTIDGLIRRFEDFAKLIRSFQPW